MFEEFSALNKVHDKVDTVGFLENVVHADDEWMVHLQQDQLFDFERVDWVVFDDDVFSNNFHSVQPIVAFALNQKYFPKSATSDAFDKFKILERCRDHRCSTKQKQGGSGLVCFFEHTVKVAFVSHVCGFATYSLDWFTFCFISVIDVVS